MNVPTPFRKSHVCVFIMILAVAAMAVAQSTVNVVYVESNIGKTTNQNSVYAFSNDGTGKLKQLTGSPYLTLGTGVFSSNPLGAPGFMADQEIVVNSAGTLLIAVNGHSNTLSVFSINPDGSLVLMNTGDANGQDPVSLGLDELLTSGTQLTVVNQAADPGQTGGTPSLTSFFVSSSGNLTPVTNATVNYPANSFPSQAVVGPGGRYMFVTQTLGGGALTSYTVGNGGKLLVNNSVKPPLHGMSFLGSAHHAKKRVVYVGMPDLNMIASYTYNSSGMMAPGKIVANQGKQIGWMATDPAGTRLYTSELNSNSVTVYDISSSNFLKPVQIQHLTLLPGGVPTSLKLDPSGKFLYVLALNDPPTGSGNFIHVLNVSSLDGSVTETATPTSIPVPTGETPMGLAVVMK